MFNKPVQEWSGGTPLARNSLNNSGSWFHFNKTGNHDEILKWTESLGIGTSHKTDQYNAQF